MLLVHSTGPWYWFWSMVLDHGTGPWFWSMLLIHSILRQMEMNTSLLIACERLLKRRHIEVFCS